MNFSNTYVNLGERFFVRTPPTPVKSPKLFLWNDSLAKELDISQTSDVDSDSLAQTFSGNQMLSGSDSISMVYAGHQFGNFNPQLGDGRAHLLGEIVSQAGERHDIQLKGSGPSAFSRSGDGRCAIGPAVREFIMSQAMKSLGVPTTQCLAVVTTGEPVYREGVKPGAVVTRVASSHIRVGTFQFFAAQGDLASLKALADYTISRHYPVGDNEALDPEESEYVALLDNVIGNQIKLVTEWMRVGFIHGVMNTDNTAISGETIDFGPCAMMGVYNPQTVYSSIDHGSRYAFGNQPHIVHWNMARFAECLLELVDQDDKTSAESIVSLINDFPSRYQNAYKTMMANKLGLAEGQEGDEAFIASMLEQMVQLKLDYTDTFNLLTKSLTSETEATKLSQSLGSAFNQWLERVGAQSTSKEQIQALMRRNNPTVIPRNHHMEEVLKASEEMGDASLANEFLMVLKEPYKESALTVKYQTTQEDYDKKYQTFCGT